MLRFVTWKRGGCPYQRAQTVGGILEAQLIDPDRALPTRSGRNHQLDRGSRLRGTTTRRAPGKLDLAAFDREGLPVHGEVERLLAVAPDIPVGRVHQLELRSEEHTSELQSHSD